MSAALAIPAARVRVPRARAPYENWRPPIAGVIVLAPVGADGLLVVDTLGRGDYAIPVGFVNDGQDLEQAAQLTLTGLPGGLSIQRRVALDQVQMRRRKVITHIVVTTPLTERDAARLTYHDPRADLRALPTARAVAELPPRAGERVLLGLQALAIGVMAYLEDGVVQRLEAVAAG